MREKQQRVLLTHDRACSLCFKRIGNSVFVAYPDASLAHYLCYKRHDPQPLALDGLQGQAQGQGQAQQCDLKLPRWMPS